VVVGRSLATAAAAAATAGTGTAVGAASSALQASHLAPSVARHSRLVGLREDVTASLAVHRAAGRAAQAAWLGSVELANAQADYESMLGRLAAATDRCVMLTTSTTGSAAAVVSSAL
jgi:hypothetical protein